MERDSESASANLITTEDSTRGSRGESGGLCVGFHRGAREQRGGDEIIFDFGGGGNEATA